MTLTIEDIQRRKAGIEQEIGRQRHALTQAEAELNATVGRLREVDDWIAFVNEKAVADAQAEPVISDEDKPLQAVEVDGDGFGALAKMLNLPGPVAKEVKLPPAAEDSGNEDKRQGEDGCPIHT